MSEQNISQEFRLKNIAEARHYFIKEINQNELMSKDNKKIFRALNHIEHSLILVSTINGWVSISAFASLVGIPIKVLSSAIGLKSYAITAGIKKYKSIIRNRKRRIMK